MANYDKKNTFDQLSKYLLELHNKGEHATSSMFLKMCIEKYGPLYLMIAENEEKKITYYHVYPLDWLNFTETPPNTFHRPDKNLQFHILKRELRTEAFMMEQYGFKFY